MQGTVPAKPLICGVVGSTNSSGLPLDHELQTLFDHPTLIPTPGTHFYPNVWYSQHLFLLESSAITSLTTSSQIIQEMDDKDTKENAHRYIPLA